MRHASGTVILHIERNRSIWRRFHVYVYTQDGQKRGSPRASSVSRGCLFPARGAEGARMVRRTGPAWLDLHVVGEHAHSPHFDHSCGRGRVSAAPWAHALPHPQTPQHAHGHHCRPGGRAHRAADFFDGDHDVQAASA